MARLKFFLSNATIKGINRGDTVRVALPLQKEEVPDHLLLEWCRHHLGNVPPEWAKRAEREAILCSPITSMQDHFSELCGQVVRDKVTEEFTLWIDCAVVTLHDRASARPALPPVWPVRVETDHWQWPPASPSK